MNIYAKGRTYFAEAVLLDGNVIIKKGSKIAPISSSSLPNKIMQMRADPEYVNSNHELIADVTFTSVSTSATFVTGTVSNGYKVWKHEGSKKFIEKKN